MIMEKVNRPRPGCNECNMFVLWIVLNHHHPTTNLFTRGAYQKLWRMVEEEAREGDALVFKAYV